MTKEKLSVFWEILLVFCFFQCIHSMSNVNNQSEKAMKRFRCISWIGILYAFYTFIQKKCKTINQKKNKLLINISLWFPQNYLNLQLKIEDPNSKALTLVPVFSSRMWKGEKKNASNEFWVYSDLDSISGRNGMKNDF